MGNGRSQRVDATADQEAISSDALMPQDMVNDSSGASQ
ncbi:MAG: hypothetical protein QOH40_1631, partial [Arthrobacter pascens]|nr:hypothetical protein [Arthrobacter pascens]